MRGRAVALLFVVLGVYALATGYVLMYRFAYVLGALILISALWMRLSLRGVEVQVESRTQRAQKGDYAEERVLVRNRSRLPKTWVEVANHSDLPGHVRGTVVALPSRDFRLWRVRTLCTHRGRFHLGPLSVTSGDPFGLFHRTLAVGEASDLLVYPSPVEIPHFALPSGETPGEEHVLRRVRQSSPNAVGVREYQHGDSFSRVHWPSTARAGRLMVKEFELDPASDLWIVLDLAGASHAGAGEESTLEYAVTITASLAKRYLEGSRMVGFLGTGDPEELVEAERGAAQLERILAALASVSANGATTLAEALMRHGQLLSRHAAIAVISPTPSGPSGDEAAVRDDWPLALSQLTRRGMHTVAVLLDGETFGGAPADLPTTLERLHGGGVLTYVISRDDDISDALRPGALLAPTIDDSGGRPRREAAS